MNLCGTVQRESGSSEDRKWTHVHEDGLGDLIDGRVHRPGTAGWVVGNRPRVLLDEVLNTLEQHG